MQLLWLLIIPIILTIVLTIFFLMKKQIRIFTNYYNELAEFLQSEPYNEAKTTLRTVDINLNKIETNKIEEIKTHLDDELMIEQTIENDHELIKIQNDKQDFAQNLIEIEDKIFLLKKKYKEGCEYLKNHKIFKIQKNIFEIKKIKSQINKISNDVEKKVREYIDEIEEINKILYKYRNQFKQLIKIFNQWKSKDTSTEFANQIDQKIELINQTNDNLSESLKKGKIREAKNYFFQYKKAIYNVYQFANYYDKFKNTIFNEAPNSLNKIKNFFNTVRIKLNSNLNYLQVNIHFEKAEQQLKTIEKSFNQFAIEETKMNIKIYYDILLSANLIINNELKAFHFMQNNNIFEKIGDFYKNTSKKYFKIKAEVDEALAIDPIYFNWIKKEEEKLIQLLNDLEDLKSRINSEKNITSLSSLSKQHKIKIYLQLIKNFNQTHDFIRNEINIFYSEGINVCLIFNRIKHLLLTMNVNLKKMNIKLKPEELRLQAELESERLNIDKVIMAKKTENNDNLKLMIEKYQLLAINYLQTIGKKIAIIKIFTILNEKYSYKRIQNPIFHKSILESENQFIEGNYESSLKLITNAIRDGIN